MKLKKFLILLLIIVLIAFFITNFSSIYTIDDYAYVIAMGLDKTDDLDLLLSLQIAIPSGSSNSKGSSSSSSSQSSSSILSTVKCKNIDDGINMINDYLGQKLNLSYCKVIVFSYDVAKDGIGNYICTATNNIELRPSCDIIVSKSKAFDFIKSSKPLLQSLSSKYYEIESSSEKNTGLTKTVSLMSFYNKYYDSLSEPFAPLSTVENSISNTQNKSFAFNSGNSNVKSTDESSSLINETSSQNNSNSSNSNESSSQNNSSSSNSNESSSQNNGNSSQTDVESDDTSSKIINQGLAIFKDDKLVGEISNEETLCYMLVSGKLNNTILNIPSPFADSDFISLNISSDKAKNKVYINGDSPFIVSNISFDARILSSTKSSNYMTKENILAIEYATNSYLKASITEFLYKTSKDLKSDFIGFGRIAVKSFKTINDWQNYNWLSKYENSNFEVNVKTNLKSSYLLIG